MEIKESIQRRIKKSQNGVWYNGRVAAFGPGDPGSNPKKDLYIIEFKSIM